MEYIIWTVVIIIYAIAQASSRTGRMSINRAMGEYGKYGLIDMQDDFSLEYDPLADIRQMYNENLQRYYLHNQPKSYLVNKDCEARLITEKNGDIWFYVKERTNGKTQGKYFEVKGDKTHASTMWAIIDMEYNALTRYSDIKALYYKLNYRFDTRGGLRYFYEPLIKKLPTPQVNKNAQNEYCRMEVQNLPNGEKIIICTEIWTSGRYSQPLKFAIYADKFILYEVLQEFSKNKNKMQDYDDLLHQYSKRPYCKVKELNREVKPIKNINSAKKLLEEIEQQEEKQKNSSVSIDEKQAEEADNVIELEKPEIEKYNERNLDL